MKEVGTWTARGYKKQMFAGLEKQMLTHLHEEAFVLKLPLFDLLTQITRLEVTNGS